MPGTYRRMLEEGGDDEIAPALAEAEGAWSEEDVEEWELARSEAWATWPSGRSSSQPS